MAAMLVLHPPKIRFLSREEDSAFEATIQEHGGAIRMVTDADSMHGHITWMTPAEVRELAIELLGLADAAEQIAGEGQ